ncbi:hypothetical protein LSTR_LSTR012794 [Laodelphax striatellus]|uniref:Uncharacterized protein n=1 Tax=Laodelphax striatellus TaxID=195883 RepID=A0A482X0I7_LAOST|nr:hypothetical protein LSTR_LSTR012794 [Laodelphax striatellus]
MPKNAALIYPYIRICLETTKEQLNHELTRMAIFKVMADIFGGYQQAYSLPLLKTISYEGNVDYRTVENCLRMQNEFKDLLNTNGLGWSPPLAINTVVTHVKQLNLTSSDGEDINPCANIYLRDPRTYASEPRSTNQERSMPIPMPIFDDNIHPNAVAIPFRDWKFRSLTTENGYRVLVDYYRGSVHCLKWLSQDWYDNSLTADFDHTFRDWIEKNVVPHFQSSEKWYPAFSGVQSILMTIQSKGNSIDNHFKVDQQYASTQKHRHNIAAKAEKKVLIWQNSPTKKANPNTARIWDRVMSRVNIVTYFTTALLFMFFIIPILIVGYKNIMVLKDLYSRLYTRKPESFKQITAADVKYENETSTISPTPKNMNNTDELPNE